MRQSPRAVSPCRAAALLGALAAGAAILLSTAAGWALVRFVFGAVPDGQGVGGCLCVEIGAA